MREKKRRVPGARGFTAIEVVVTAVVLAILAAYATPKLFGLKDQAKEAEETLKIQDIASRHAKEMLEQGKRSGSLPTLGGTVGFREPVVAEPAPDTAPMLVDWNFPGFLHPSGRINKTTWTDTSFDASDLFYVGSKYSSDGVFRCDNPNLYANPRYDGSAVIQQGTPALYFHMFNREDLSLARRGALEDAPVSQAAPTCQVNLKFRVFSVASSYGLFPSPWNAKGYYEEHTITPTGMTARRVHAPIGLYAGTESVVSVSQPYLTSGNSVEIWANSFRFDCSSYSAIYGVPYVIRGLTGFSAAELAAWHGQETATSWVGLGTTPPSYALEQISSSPVMNRVNLLLQQRYPTRNLGYCERQGPAPAVPPSDPGDPGAYPMSTDGSGYCLSPGRKLPTYRDGAGTPTTSPSDPVAELATDAVDDATNCPG